jgi:hypothetical protein
MEIFVKKEVIPPVGIFLKFLAAAVYRTLPAAIAEKEPRDSFEELLRDE